MELLQQKLSSFNIILASQSPRRQELIKSLNIDFSIKIIDGIEETYPEDLPAEEVALFLSKLKFDEYIKHASPDDLIITADTTVCVDNLVLNKPRDRDDAVRMLELLSGRNHRVITGLTIGSVDKLKSFKVTTSVAFKRLLQDEILYYVDNYKPFDKAGAYGIQEWIGHIGITEISGSYFNVVGLPVQRLYEELMAF